MGDLAGGAGGGFSFPPLVPDRRDNSVKDSDGGYKCWKLLGKSLAEISG